VTSGARCGGTSIHDNPTTSSGAFGGFHHDAAAKTSGRFATDETDITSRVC
jgi:hypothetical protein